MRFPQLDPRHAIVTGASTGIGAATAVRLRDAGWTVLPTARKPEDLDALRAQGFAPLALDMTDSQSIRDAADEALRLLDGRPGALVNNAGVAISGPIEDLSRDAMRLQFEINVFGMQELTNLLLPAMIARGQGRIVNVSSVLGRIAVPLTGMYCASKFAMEAMSDVLRIELTGTGVAVCLIEPGPITTEFRRTAVRLLDERLDSARSRFAPLLEHELARRKQNPNVKRMFTRPPSAVAERILHAVSSPRPRRRYPITPQARAATWVRRFAPYALTDGLMALGLRKAVRRASPHPSGSPPAPTDP